jgi:hypothetical protein
MKQKIALLTIILFTSIVSFSQLNKISGTVKDTIDKMNISNAVTAILRKSDSVLIKFSRTDVRGNFTLSNVAAGQYIFMISHPRFGDYVEDIEVKDKDISMGAIALTPKSKLLQDIVIRTGSPIKIKGDTVEYTADSFKVTANANVEELLKKMPGIQVDKNGEIKAMGETVKKVLVDGEEFFGEDPGMAIKNLRADAVNKVQVFDKKSEQAEFTGIDDGQKSKTINLQLKENKKKGYFGKAELAGGLKDNYNNQLMMNAFKGKRKISGYALMGNIGQSGLGWNDSRNYGGSEGFSSGFDEESGGMWMSYSGVEEDEDFNAAMGFARNWNAGLQYNNKWKDKHTLNSGYKFAKISLRSGYTSFSQNFLPNTTWTENTVDSKLNSKTVNAGNASYDWKIDSFNTLKISVKLNHTETESNNRNYVDRFNDLGYKIESPTTKINNNKKNSFSSTILFKHKFKKPKRTLSWNTELTYLDADGYGFLLGSNNYYVNNLFDRRDSLDQYKTSLMVDRNINSKISYTEPLAKDFYLELNYNFKAAIASNDRSTFIKNTNGKYENLVDSLSNNFDQDITSHNTGMNFRYVKKKYNYSFGSAVSFSRFNLKDLSNNKSYHYNFTNFFPQASFNYNPKQNKNYRFSYKGSTSQPSLNQLQPLVENNNPLSIYQGNPNLQQSFRHEFNAGYNTYNFLKERSIWSNLTVSVLENAFSSSVITTDSGKTFIKPVNVDGVLNVNLWSGMWTKLKKSGISLYIGPNFNFSKNIDYQNNIRNVSRNLSVGVNGNVNKSKDKKYDVGMDYDFGWNMNRTSLQNRTVRYFTLTTRFNGSYHLPKKFKVGSDVEYNVRQKTSEFDMNTNNVIWNAYLSKDILKDMFTIKLSITDILKENNGFSRVATSNYFSQTIRERLQQYWLLTLTWNFSKNGKPSQGW